MVARFLNFSMKLFLSVISMSAQRAAGTMIAPRARSERTLRPILKSCMEHLLVSGLATGPIRAAAPGTCFAILRVDDLSPPDRNNFLGGLTMRAPAYILFALLSVGIAPIAGGAQPS